MRLSSKWHYVSLNLITMITLALITIAPMFAAAGWAFLYLLCGGGLGGAFLIFIVFKMFGKGCRLWGGHGAVMVLCPGGYGSPAGLPLGAGQRKLPAPGK